MAPAVAQQPLIPDIFNKSQHETTAGSALSQLRAVYKSMRFKRFESPFRNCVCRLIQSPHSEYFKTSCDFLTKFLKTLSESNDDKALGLCIKVVLEHFEVDHEGDRLNAVYFISKLLAQVTTLDEEIHLVLVEALADRVRDVKPLVRAHAVYASRTFQDKEIIRKCFDFFFYRDPEIAVRKALLTVMDTKVFGHTFLVDSTQDTHDALRIGAFLRLGKIDPKDLSDDPSERKKLIHRVIHNGLIERVPRVSHAFHTHTLKLWLPCLYDGVDLKHLLDQLDVIKHHDQIKTLLDKIFERDLEAKQLAKVVYQFRLRWLDSQSKSRTSALGLRLPGVAELDEQLTVAWLTLINFTRKHRSLIEEVKVKINRKNNNSIENLIESLEIDEDTFELFELLTPDLVDLLDFLKEFIQRADKSDSEQLPKLEFIYQSLINLIGTYQIGDESERKKVQEVLISILNENLLVTKFTHFILPIMEILFKLVYKTSSNLMVNYIAELITNVRSHLEDICEPPAPSASTSFLHSAIKAPQAARVMNRKKVRISGHIAGDYSMLSSTMIHGNAMIVSEDNPNLFKDHPGELIKCLQMYFGCLQNVKLTQVSPTMLNHLKFLTFSTYEAFSTDVKIIRLATACNGITALVDKNFALEPQTLPSLVRGLESVHKDIVVVSLKSIVDIVLQHNDIDWPEEKVASFLCDNLSNFGGSSKESESEFITTLVVSTTKLLYHERISDPELLADLIIWWYHPDTPTWPKQHIGVFLPLFINDLSAKAKSPTGGPTQSWLQNLLEDNFLISIEALHNYVTGPGSELMTIGDINSLISFLCKLIPVPFHSGIRSKLEDRIAELLDDNRKDLAKYYELSAKELDRP